MNKIIFTFLLFSNLFYAQTDSVTFNFFPDDLHILPSKANHREPKIGILYFPSNGDLKLDLGLPMDILQIKFNEKVKLTLGFEAMVYLLSTSYKEQRLQIDAFDGLFGGNTILSFDNDDNKIFTRFRFIHNSAHFVDGHWDRTTNDWIDGKDPIPWAQDFGELTFAQEFYTNFGLLKYYSSAAYCTLVRPKDIKRFFFNLGFEINFDSILGNVFNEKTNLFFAYNLSINGLPEYQGSNNLLAGIKFGDWFGKGVILYLSYFSGNNVISEYYLERVNKIGLGFLIEYF